MRAAARGLLCRRLVDLLALFVGNEVGAWALETRKTWLYCCFWVFEFMVLLSARIVAFLLGIICI